MVTRDTRLPLCAVGLGSLATPDHSLPFELDRQQIDDVERGASDSDWQPAKDAAQKIAYTEDRAIFEGYPAAGIGGIGQAPAIRSSRSRLTSVTIPTPSRKP